MDSRQAERKVLYDPIEPYRTGWIEAGDGHRVYFEESGRAAGFPALFVHGGPGSRSRPAHRRFFDPAFYRIVLFDQRGCGRSTPAGEIAHNSTAHLLADMERLRRELGVERWLLFGGSWGSTLSLAYAVAHPDRVAGMVLRGVFLASRDEVGWYLEGLRRFLPHAWSEFAGDVSGPILPHYRALLEDADPQVALAAARRWSQYEARALALGGPDGGSGTADAGELLAGVRIQLHYLGHDCFLRPDELLAGLGTIGPKPIVIVQGELDMLCPPATAVEVAARLPGAELHLVPGGGHSALQPAIAAQLCGATERLRDRLRAPI
jgi:proline iminopeptidase